MTKKSKGSYTLEEIERLVFDWPSEVDISEPLSLKVEAGLMNSVPADLYPFVLELISTKEGFISKRLALNFLGWFVKDKKTWLADPDKILSIRRVRVGRFLKLVTAANEKYDHRVPASRLVERIEGHHHFNLTQSKFSLAVTYIASQEILPLFRVLSALDDLLTIDGYDVGAALLSVVEWATYLKSQKGGMLATQLELF